MGWAGSWEQGEEMAFQAAAKAGGWNERGRAGGPEDLDLFGAKGLFWRREVLQDWVGWWLLQQVGASTSCPQAPQWGVGGSVSDSSSAPSGSLWPSRCVLCFQALLLGLPLVLGLVYRESLVAALGLFTCRQRFLAQPDLLALCGLWHVVMGLSPVSLRATCPGL